MKKNLVIFEVNECDFKFFLYGAKKYNFPIISQYLKKKNKIKTFTNDKEEGLNLDPWVQWVSFHTGLLSRKHKVFRLGQKLEKKYLQIWENISKNIRVSLWGLFNSNLRKRGNIDVFFPDPWSFKEKAYPKVLNDLLALPRYYATNYPNIKKLSLITYAALFFKNIFFSKTLIFMILNTFKFLSIFFRCGTKSFNLYFFLDLISVVTVKNILEKKNSDLSIIALNSFAHYQHNYWDTKKFEKYYFWYLNEMVKLFIKIEKNYSSVIVFNGFSQKKIKPRFYLRPKNPKEFLKILNINFLKIEPNMTTGAQVFFKNTSDKLNCINVLRSVKFSKKSFFEVVDYKNKNKIFFKFNIYFDKDLNNLSNFDLNKIKNKCISV